MSWLLTVGYHEASRGLVCFDVLLKGRPNSYGPTELLHAHGSEAQLSCGPPGNWCGREEGGTAPKWVPPMCKEAGRGGVSSTQKCPPLHLPSLSDAQGMHKSPGTFSHLWSWCAYEQQGKESCGGSKWLLQTLRTQIGHSLTDSGLRILPHTLVLENRIWCIIGGSFDCTSISPDSFIAAFGRRISIDGLLCEVQNYLIRGSVVPLAMFAKKHLF